MDPTQERNRGPNPKAPAELSQFAFLVGKWKFSAKFQSQDGTWQPFQGTWTGRFILDGYVIADEYEMVNSSGEVLVLGMNFRVYDVKRQTWSIKWLSALDGTWTNLTCDEFGGVRFDGRSVTYSFRAERTSAWPYTRATYTNISRTHFTWIGEKSDDRTTWNRFMVVECQRVGN